MAGKSSGFQNAMTVDVEDYFHVSALASAISTSEWGQLEFRANESTRKILDLFDQENVKATFFVLGWVADRSPQIVRDISARGHEIACHGWSHQLVYNQEKQVFRQEAARCKALLEDICGQRVRGYRAASYSITFNSLWALDELIDLGFDYDSSVFPIRHDRYGIPGANPHPGLIVAPSGRSIVEFPLSTAVLGGRRIPCCGGGYFRVFPYAMSKWLLCSINEGQRKPFIFYLHPWEIDPDQPRFNAGIISNFRHYTNLKRCEGRLRRLTKDFSFGSVAQVMQGLQLLAKEKA